mgnify:CR=1 FL=1
MPSVKKPCSSWWFESWIVTANSSGNREVYVFTNNTWTRVGLENGTVQFSSDLYEYTKLGVGYGNEFYDALKNPHDGIDYTPSEIVIKYKEWAKSNNIPEPKDMVAEEGLDTTPMVEFQNSL